jgi:ATP-binding cassette, subfamily B, heavy metal transporter
MRSFGIPAAAPHAASPPSGATPPPKSDWATLRRLFPYLWIYKWRVMAALAFMVGAKLANVGVP